MVAAAFPVAKLGFLLVKQVAKPIAKSIAARARNSRLFREYICIPVAQAFHWYEIKLKMRMMNVGGKVTKVPKLNETKAIEQGSEILSEFILLSLASVILIYEYNRSKEKDDAKENALAAERERLKNKMFELEFKIEKQTVQIRELARTVIHIEEDIHKRSLRRIFEDKPKINPEVVESAKETENNQVFLVQPLIEHSSQAVLHSEDQAAAAVTSSDTEEAETTPVKKGILLAAATDILEGRNK